MTLKIALLLTVHTLISMAACWAQDAFEAERTDFGSVFKPTDAVLETGHLSAVIRVPWEGALARYYRLHLRVKDSQGLPWALSIRSETGQLLSTFDETAIECASSGGCWTKRLAGESIVAELATKVSGLTLEIDSALFMPVAAEKPFYSGFEGKEIRTFSDLAGADNVRKSQIRRNGERLGLLIASAPLSQTVKGWCCSGVRLTKDLFLTNWHCGAAKGADYDENWRGDAASAACRSAIIDLSWDEDGASREYGCRDVVYKDKALDAAILRLGEIADGEALVQPFSELTFAASDVPEGSDLQLLQHNACTPKSAAYSCNVLSSQRPAWTPEDGSGPWQEFSYNCPTKGGSSGSPVFNAQTNELVGIHHKGYSEDDLEKENRGIKIGAILADIKLNKPIIFGEIIGNQ